MKIVSVAGRRCSILKYMPLVLLLAAAPARGAVFMWKDSAGIAHYTNKEYDVPARYKAKAKVMYPEASDAGGAQSGKAAVQAAPVMQPDVRSVVPPAPVISTPPKTPEQKSRRKRERNRDDDE